MRFRFFAWVIVRSNSSSPQLCVFFRFGSVDSGHPWVRNQWPPCDSLLAAYNFDTGQIWTAGHTETTARNAQHPADRFVRGLSIDIEYRREDSMMTRIFFRVISTTFSCFMAPTVWFIERIIAEWNLFYCLTVTNLLSFLRYRNCI